MPLRVSRWGLVLLLGALRLAVGPAGAAVNLAFAASTMPRPVRMALAVLVTFAAVLLWSLMVVTMR